jgi:capsular polysaccharide biosynthesis protein
MTKVPVALRRVQPQIANALRWVTRVVGPVTRRLSPVLGPRGVPVAAERSTRRYVAEGVPSHAHLEVVRPSEHLKRDLPDGEPAHHHRFVDEAEYDLPEAFVLDLAGGKVLGGLGAVITDDHRLLFDVSPYFAIDEPRHHPIFRRLLLPEPEPVDGSVAVLATRGDENFYHFMLDTLPRLGLLEDTRPLDSLDRFVVRHHRPFHRQLLQMCGVPSDRILDPSTHPYVHARRLVVPSIPALHGQTPGWVVDFLRRRLMPTDPVPRDRPSRFYISRGVERRTRAVVNEAAVIDMLAVRGIEPVSLDGMSISEQVELFRGADMIVSPHGAGLTNIVFCGPRTRVVEVFSPHYVNPCFWKLSSQIEGVDYAYVLGTGTSPPPERDMEGVSVDITVDLDRLGKVLDGPG